MEADKNFNSWRGCCSLLLIRLAFSKLKQQLKDAETIDGVENKEVKDILAFDVWDEVDEGLNLIGYLLAEIEPPDIDGYDDEDEDDYFKPCGICGEMIPKQDAMHVTLKPYGLVEPVHKRGPRA